MPDFVHVDDFYINLNFVCLVELRDIQNGVLVVIDIVNSTINGRDQITKKFRSKEIASHWVYENFGVHCVNNPLKIGLDSPISRVTDLSEWTESDRSPMSNLSNGTDVPPPPTIAPTPTVAPTPLNTPVRSYLASPVKNILVGSHKKERVGSRKVVVEYNVTEDGDVGVSDQHQRRPRRPYHRRTTSRVQKSEPGSLEYPH